MNLNKRVAICGSHSTGKTSLLSAINCNNKINEVAREVMKLMGGKTPQLMTREEKEMFEESILINQLQSEYKNTRDYGGFLSDRSVIDVLAYSYYLLEGNSKYIELYERVKKYASGYDFLFYTPIEFPLVNDGVRFEGDEFQKTIDDRIKFLANELGYQLIPLTGSVEQRVAKIKEYIGELD